MADFHHSPEWLRLARRMRPIIAAQLPAPCTNCGGTVWPSQTWHIGHRIDVALAPELGLEASLLGPAHARCNLSSGGKLGAARRKARASARTATPEW